MPDCFHTIGRLPAGAFASIDGCGAYAKLQSSDNTRGYHAEPCNKHVQADGGAWGRRGSNSACSDGQDLHRASAEKNSFHGLANGDVPAEHRVVRRGMALEPERQMERGRRERLLRWRFRTDRIHTAFLWISTASCRIFSAGWARLLAAHRR